MAHPLHPRPSQWSKHLLPRWAMPKPTPTSPMAVAHVTRPGAMARAPRTAMAVQRIVMEAVKADAMVAVADAAAVAAVGVAATGARASAWTWMANPWHPRHKAWH